MSPERRAGARQFLRGAARPRGRRIAAVIALCVGLSPSLGSTGTEGLRVLGVLRLDLRKPFDINDNVNTPLRLLVDPTVHRGFLLASEEGGKYHVVVYDLVRLRREATIVWPLPDLDPNVAAAIDPAHHRLIIASITGGGGTAPSLRCDQGSTFVTIDTRRLTTTAAVLPCVNRMPFAVEGIAYYAPANKLYAVGVPVPERSTVYQSGLDPLKERTFYLQIDPETLHVDWSADASQVCDWHETDGGSVVARSKGDLISFCYQGGNAYNVGGVRGLAVVMPIAPLEAGRAPTFRTSPTYTDSVVPIVDARTGRLLLRSGGPPYGPAVWGFDPFAERFFGVAPAGESYGFSDDRFSGFDAINGRLYIVNPKGMVLIDTRGDSLPGGESFPVLANMHGGSQTGGSYSHDIVVDGGLRRLFVAYPRKEGFIVVEDHVPVPPEAEPADLDQGTADIPEVREKTSSAFAGAADAFGVHVVVVGGIPGAIDNYDQTCFDPNQSSVPSPTRTLDPNGRCFADQKITTGNREYFVAQSGLEVGSESGASAFGSMFRVPGSDSATDADFRSLAGCFTDRLPAQTPTDPRDAVATFCRDQTPLGQFKEGTHAKDGSDVPFPGSLCVDETGKAANDDNPTPLGSSSATCDNTGHSASAAAALGLVGLPDAAKPLLSVARASSSVVTARTPEGVVTTVSATVSGIDIAGVFSIGRVHTEATTKAHGRTGTTLAAFKRTISDVRGPGFECASSCVPGRVVEAFNRAFATQARLRAPAPLAISSQHGFQGLVLKDPALRASDVAILNDDTDTFNGLDLIVNNDGFNATTSGPNARSRFVVGLAGVHAESRYGIFPVGAGGGGSYQPGIPIPPLPPLPSTVPVPAPVASTGPHVPPLRPTIARIVRETWGLIVNHPGQAAVLFLLLGVLASPVYLGLRSRSLGRSLRT